MGYTTDFVGTLAIAPALTFDQAKYIQAFSGTRRMTRLPGAVDNLDDPLRKAADLPPGRYGDFYVGEYVEGGGYPQPRHEETILDVNRPPGAMIKKRGFRRLDAKGNPTILCTEGYPHEGHGCVIHEWIADFGYADQRHAQPGLWCGWTVSDDGRELMWDGGEKFYFYPEWLVYLIESFFKPWQRTLNGQIRWQGEIPDDSGVIVVRDNDVRLVVLDDDALAIIVDKTMQAVDAKEGT